ncbi:guanylate kinase [Enterococcus plantarum]|uniref:guanylate kinase n=1 Tax=Enterococcus plantarum TaxID=1077675 RepID=UPI001A8D6BF4|nr:guanylate kinase [Enterococcus plantarum]
MKRTELKHPFFVVIGPSGSGKTKVAEAVFPASYKVISHTTRPIRKEETDEIDYYFESEERFEKLLITGALAEHDTYHGYQYGVGRAELIEKTSDHYAYDVLTIKGFQAIENQFGNMVIPIFLEVSKENVLARLQTRDEDTKIILQRGALYDQEIKNKSKVIEYTNSYIINANQPFENVVNDVKQVVNETLKIKLR